MKIIAYGFIKQTSLEAMAEEVNKAIAEGCVPFGTILETGSPDCYIQPIVKYEV